MKRMNLSTSTSLFHINKRFNKRYTVEESLDLCKKAGFRYLDFNFYDHGLEDEILAQDDWKERVIEIKAYANKLGLTFNQSHAFCYRTKESTDNTIDRKWFDERIRRSIIASSILGIKWTVVHPNSYLEVDYDKEKNLHFNFNYWKPFIELGTKHNVGIAFENMFPSTGHKRYCSDVEELIELVDIFESDYVGACWDTGHAQLASQDQAASIIKLGSRLKALHINDNNDINSQDEHLIPYFGTINWEQILRALKEIDYAFDFTYELKQASQILPIEADLDLGKFVFNLGQIMISKF